MRRTYRFRVTPSSSAAGPISGRAARRVPGGRAAVARIAEPWSRAGAQPARGGRTERAGTQLHAAYQRNPRSGPDHGRMLAAEAARTESVALDEWHGWSSKVVQAAVA